MVSRTGDKLKGFCQLDFLVANTEPKRKDENFM